MITIALLIAFAALLVGPKKAIEMSREAGVILARLKATRDGLMQEVKEEVQQAMEAAPDAASRNSAKAATAPSPRTR